MDKRDDLEQTQPLSPGGEQEPQAWFPCMRDGRRRLRKASTSIWIRSSTGSTRSRPASGREVSDEEREGVPATDTEASSPLGVGESINRRGEDVARQA